MMRATIYKTSAPRKLQATVRTPVGEDEVLVSPSVETSAQSGVARYMQE